MLPRGIAVDAGSLCMSKRMLRCVHSVLRIRGAAFEVNLRNGCARQVREVTAHFGITFDESKFMSICSQCNTRGFIGPIPPDQAREIGDPHNIPLKVFGKVSEFWVCKNTDCRKIYWEGSKYRHAGLEFRKFFDAPIRPEDTQTDEKW
eukprot:m.1253388 g.1253388  ORF g.1253388 m.1253388 type:complete len:148 (+) comp24704_c1_seq21:4424-4867(+)